MSKDTSEPLSQQYTEKKYPLEFADKYKGKSVAILGVGQAYRKYVEPALNFLGVKNREVYDLNPKKVRDEEVKIVPSDITKDKITYILTPNNFHAFQSLDLLKRGMPFYVEKPVAINSSEINQLDEAVKQAKEPSYYGDYYLFKALGLFSLMGIEMPFKEHLRVEQDDNSALRRSIDSGKPLLGKIKKIEAHLLEGGDVSAATIEGREWLGELSQGGGMLFDLMVHLTNLAHILGSSIDALDAVRLGVRTEERGVYSPIELHDWTTAEDFAQVSGTMVDGATFDFVVGKYAKEHNRYVLLEDENGTKLKLSFTTDNSVEWIDANGKIKGKVVLLADPYMLTMVDAIEHLTKGKGPRFYQTQRESVIMIEKMHAVGREGKL